MPSFQQPEPYRSALRVSQLFELFGQTAPSREKPLAQRLAAPQEKERSRHECRAIPPLRADEDASRHEREKDERPDAGSGTPAEAGGDREKQDP